MQTILPRDEGAEQGAGPAHGSGGEDAAAESLPSAALRESNDLCLLRAH